MRAILGNRIFLIQLRCKDINYTHFCKFSLNIFRNNYTKFLIVLIFWDIQLYIKQSENMNC